jgi:site-specific DNA-methyltransferase (adenine-specific)
MKSAATPSPQPYYQDDAVTLYCGDALEIVEHWTGPIASLVLTDPPYCSGAHESARRGKRASTTPESVSERPTIAMDDMGLLGYEWTSRRWFMAVRRFTVEGGHVACFTDWRMAPWVMKLMEIAGWRLTNLVVWDKGYPGLGSGFRAQHEFIVVASNGEPEWHSYDFGNVLKSTRVTKGEHPHEKPVDLLSRLIQTCAPPQGVVFDLFAGAGTTLEAAKLAGRRAVGIEIDPVYCDIAVRRLSQEVLDLAV